MWPPLFHVALGLFLVPGWPADVGALVFVGLIAAWLGWRLHSIARTLFDGPGSWLVPVLVLTTPIVATLFSVVMIDIAIAALSLESTYWLARYWRSDRQGMPRCSASSSRSRARRKGTESRWC